MITTVKLLRIRDVIALTGLSRSTIYAKLDRRSPYYDEEFPKPRKLSKGKNGAIAWLLSEIENWQLTRLAIT
ncbi:AlpA family phage regulatory protein [Methylomonas koyamae]|uniref:helix-turn-helix transcriptional regulator n=1 Tax=Methylomonas koyamae TaxID=702114 RepID=UPI0007C90D20